LAQSRAHLDAVSVHLFFEQTGVLSEDIGKISDFGSWNGEPRGTGIPDGERFESLVIKLRFTAEREVFAKGTQARVMLRSTEGKPRTRIEDVRDVYVGPEGTTHKLVFLKDVACKPMRLTVTGDGKPIRIDLPFSCGE
jgi:hypothetical protein